jgi:hypothetical protein
MKGLPLRLVLAVTLTLLGVRTAHALTDAEKCEAGKNKVAGKYAACRQKAVSTAIKKGLMAPDYSKCDAKFTDKWGKVETDGAGMCPTNGDVAAAQGFITTHADAVATALAGAGFSTCGNGVIESPEQCDWGTLGGADCNSATSGAQPNGTLDCTIGVCTFDTSGCYTCMGSIVGGACWFLGADGESCDATCAAQGLTYDPATATYAGSGGNLANCVSVLTAVGGLIGPTFGDLPGCSPQLIGCTVSMAMGYGRCTDPTTDGPSAIPGFQRACACQ